MIRVDRFREAAGRNVLRWICPPALLLAGLAALSGPAPWPWIGGSAALAGAGAWLWAGRLGRRAEAEAGRRIGELNAVNARLADGEKLHAALLESLPVGVMAVGAERPVYANRTAVDFLGGRVTETGTPLPAAVRSVTAEARRGRASSGQFVQGLPRRIIEVSAHPPDGGGGGAGLIMIHLVDVTERRETDRIRQDFAAAASHELKTPAAAVRAAAETVLTALEDDPEVALDFAGRILDNAVRMSRIVNDLLDLSRLESGALKEEPFDLADVLGEEAQRFGGASPAVEFGADPTPMLGNPSDMALAFRNLLENAVRNTPGNGWVRASVGSENGEARVEVSDNGAGIPAADLPRIFERFYRVDEARSRAAGGTGLGLAIVKHVADLHRGRVEAESRLGEGSTFRICVPVIPPGPAG